MYGSPWQPEFNDWAFNLNRGEECREKWDMIPKDTDILITHGMFFSLRFSHFFFLFSSLGPPHGRLGGVTMTNYDAGQVLLSFLSFCNLVSGCEELIKVIKDVKPLVHVYGHVHEGYGVHFIPGMQTIFINASSVNFNYRATNPPIIFDIYRKE